ncbi:HNH/ENDO VII family nuclease [Streptococcus equinus]|uniref:HNH/ENDO VII family nuclease n=1 Tax=Streptococcus equinus TaxID=1335 RepID=UPI003C704BCE
MKMKKILTIFCAFVLFFTLCLNSFSNTYIVKADVKNKNTNNEKVSASLKEQIYEEVVDKLGTSDCFVENIETKYVSQEYLEELTYNSKENIYFGYTESELEKLFQNKKFVFTYDSDSNSTVVKKLEDVDTTYGDIIKNVAVGTGVILICATVALTTSSTAPAVSVIFAASAKSGAIVAAQSGLISSVISAAIEYNNTEDINKALKKGALEGSKDFKWGAFTGAIVGGTKVASSLKGATLKGLTMNEATQIQKESRWPLDIIKNLKSKEEYNLYKKAGLTFEKIDGQTALVTDIDLKYKSKLAGKTVTNFERMKKGYAPIDPKSKTPYELHHVGQRENSPLAILTQAQHRLGENNKILHDSKISKGVHKEISNADWAKQKKAFWKAFSKKYNKN